MGVEDLNSILWAERELLDRLEFAMQTERWALATGRIGWLSRATDQVKQTTSELRKTEILRAVAAEDVAVHGGLASSPSLADIAAQVPEPWRSILLDQRAALLDAMTAIEGLSITSMAELSAFVATVRPEGDGRCEQPGSVEPREQE